MKRRPYSLPKEDSLNPVPVEIKPVNPNSRWPRWLSTIEAAIYLQKFRRKDGKPSTGAIRNMIYRKQVRAYKQFGRDWIDRLELDQLIKLSPQIGGVQYGI